MLPIMCAQMRYSWSCVTPLRSGFAFLRGSIIRRLDATAATCRFAAVSVESARRSTVIMLAERLLEVAPCLAARRQKVDARPTTLA
eukprot:5976403-Prymnesium_polylepis.1